MIKKSKLFDQCLRFVLKHEGGHVNDPKDPGGETIFGISRRAHPEAWANGRPTIEQAGDIYHRDYWMPLKCDDMPPEIALCVFDLAVNAGNRRAAMMLQENIKVKADGVIGPVTIAAVNRADTINLCRSYTADRIMFYAGLDTFSRFGLGWVRRSVDCFYSAINLGN